jgi:hypothetical protein
VGDPDPGHQAKRSRVVLQGASERGRARKPEERDARGSHAGLRQEEEAAKGRRQVAMAETVRGVHMTGQYRSG